MIVPVILAGGRGERFWPYSNTQQPKQLLPLVTQKSMLEDTLNHISSWKIKAPTYIIASKNLEAPMRKIVGKRKDVVLVGEPVGRNTAAAIALACKLISEKYPNATMAVLTADHAISPSQALMKAFKAAAELAESEECLVTFGINPTRPETGYGYIEVTGSEKKVQGLPTFSVKRFLEKPSVTTAQKFLKTKKHFWNSGLFCWQVNTIWKLFAQHLPQMYQAFEKVKSYNTQSPQFPANLKKLYHSVEGESIDYGIMEHAPSIKVVIPEFSWDDIGSWTALDRLHQADAQQNRLLGQGVLEDSQNLTIFNSEKGIIATYGVKDLLIVQHNGVTLVCHKDKRPDLKVLVKKVGQETKWKKFL